MGTGEWELDNWVTASLPLWAAPFWVSYNSFSEQLLQPKGKLLKETLAQQDAAQTTPPQISFFRCQIHSCLGWGRSKGVFLSLLEMSIKSQNSDDADVHKREHSRSFTRCHAGKTNQSCSSGQAGRDSKGDQPPLQTHWACCRHRIQTDQCVPHVSSTKGWVALTEWAAGCERHYRSLEWWWESSRKINK